MASMGVYWEFWGLSCYGGIWEGGVVWELCSGETVVSTLVIMEILFNLLLIYYVIFQLSYIPMFIFMVASFFLGRIFKISHFKDILHK